MTERKFGLIFGWEDEMACRCIGKIPDVDKINEMSAPWDATDQPGITTWEAFEVHARRQGDIRERCVIGGHCCSSIFDLTLYLNKKNDELFGTTQQQNDCAAWAATRCYLAMVLHQMIRGAEQSVETLNPMALYAAASDYELSVNNRIPNGGRTIYAIAEASCMTGNSPASVAGNYNGRCVYTQEMANARKVASNRQMGWATFNSSDKDAIIDCVFTACRGGYPVIFGNTTAVQDGHDLDSNGVAVARCNGSSWGGGHAQAWIDYKKVNGTEYVLYANSHGNRYTSNDKQIPGWSVWMPKETVKRMISSYFDMLVGTWAEAPRMEFTDLNPRIN